MRAGVEAEEAIYRRGRLEFQEHMQQKREKARVANELKEAKASLQRARKEQRDAEAVVTAMEEVNVYSLDMLGKGKKMGGAPQHQKGTFGSVAALAQGSRVVARADEPVGIFQNCLGSRDGGGSWGGLGGTLCRVGPTSAQRPRRGATQRAVCVHAQRDQARFRLNSCMSFPWDFQS